MPGRYNKWYGGATTKILSNKNSLLVATQVNFPPCCHLETTRNIISARRPWFVGFGYSWHILDLLQPWQSFNIDTPTAQGMMDGVAYIDFLKISLICILWYLCSASDNILGKVVLSEFPYPMTMTMTHLVTASIFLGPIRRFMSVPPGRPIEKKYFYVMILPLALGKFISSVSSYISIWKVSVSYAHTGKYVHNCFVTHHMFTDYFLYVWAVVAQRLVLLPAETSLNSSCGNSKANEWIHS